MNVDERYSFQRNDRYTDHRPRSTSQAGAVRKTNVEGDHVRPSFPLMVFRREKVPQRKNLYEQFRSSRIPNDADWQQAADRVLPSSQADWRVANMYRSEPAYCKRFIYSSTANAAGETFAQCPLPCTSTELSGICESIADWLNEISYLTGWDPIVLTPKEDVWLDWGDDDFRIINEGENVWIRRDPGSHPCQVGEQVRQIRNEFVLNANHECNFTIEAGPRFGKTQKRASMRVTAYEGSKPRDTWGVLGPRVQILEAPTEVVAELAAVFLQGVEMYGTTNPGWFDWWDIQLDRAKESYLKRPKFFGLPPELDAGVAATLEGEWRRVPPGARYETEACSHPAEVKKPVNVLWGKGNQLPWSAFENSRHVSADGRKRAIRFILEPIPCRPSLPPLFPFRRWEHEQLKAVQKHGPDNGCPQQEVPASLTWEQRRHYRGPMRDHINEVHAKFVDMDLELRSRSKLKRDMIEKGDMSFRKLSARTPAPSGPPPAPSTPQPSRTQSARPAGKDDWGEPSMWSEDGQRELERDRDEIRRQAQATSRLPTPQQVRPEQRWPTPETSERLPNPPPRSRPTPSPMPSARQKRDMTPRMAPVKEVEEPQAVPKAPGDASRLQSLPKPPPIVTDDRVELRKLEAKANPPAQPSAPVDPKMHPDTAAFLRTGTFTGPIPPRPQRDAPGKRKNAAATEQIEAEDEVNNARRVEEGLPSLDPTAPPGLFHPRPERPTPGRWETQEDLDAQFAAITVEPLPELDPQQVEFRVLKRSDLETAVRMKSFWQPSSGSSFGFTDGLQEVRGEHFASSETALLKAQEFYGGFHQGVAAFRFHLWNMALRKKFIRTLRLAVLDYTLDTGRSTERKRRMVDCLDMRPKSATRYACDSTQHTQPSTEGEQTDPPVSRRAPSPRQSRDPNEPRGRTLVRRGLVPRSRSVAPTDLKPDTGVVSTQAHVGFASAAMGSFGRENGYKLGWLDGLPLSQTQRIQAACVSVRGNRKIQFFVCFGCARYCSYCDNKPGCHCHKNCKYPRCEGKQPSNELVWWESRKEFRWPWRMSNTYSARELHVDDACTTLKAGVVWVGSKGQTNHPEERHSLFITADFVREQCSLPWGQRGPFPFVVHVSNASGTKRNVPCLQTDGRVAPGTGNHQVAFCEQQNDMRTKWASARKAPQRLWDNAWNVDGGESPHSYGPDHPALLCKLQNCTAAEWCSYLWCTGWFMKNGRWEVCWSACRHMADEVVAY